MNVRVITTEKLPEQFDDLIEQSKLEGHNFVEKTKKEWLSGKNSFSQEGEKFFLAYEGDILVGCGGVNIDPYTDDKRVGRVRHLYVLPNYRRKGIAHLMLDRIVEASKASFSILRLRANSVDPGSHKFYSASGFSTTKGDDFETHRLHL